MKLGFNWQSNFGGEDNGLTDDDGRTPGEVFSIRSPWHGEVKIDR